MDTDIVCYRCRLEGKKTIVGQVPVNHRLARKGTLDGLCPIHSVIFVQQVRVWMRQLGLKPARLRRGKAA